MISTNVPSHNRSRSLADPRNARFGLRTNDGSIISSELRLKL